MTGSDDTPDSSVRRPGKTRPEDEHRPDLVGDGYDPEPLMTAKDVGEVLRVPHKAVYDLPIPRVRISRGRVRWRPEDVRSFIENRVQSPT